MYSNSVALCIARENESCVYFIFRPHGPLCVLSGGWAWKTGHFWVHMRLLRESWLNFGGLSPGLCHSRWTVAQIPRPSSPRLSPLLSLPLLVPPLPLLGDMGVE